MSGWERFLFVRHGETAMAGRFCGHLDPPLNDQGREQASALAEGLRARPIEVIFSSDLERAAMTAAAIAAGREIQVDARPGLREISFGDWEGLRWAEIEDRDRVYAEEWMKRFPALPASGGESYAAFRARVLRELEGLGAMARGRHAVVVAHAGVLRVVLREMCGTSERTAWRRTATYCCQVEGAEVVR